MRRGAETGVAREVAVRRHAPVAKPEARHGTLAGTLAEANVTRCRGTRRGSDIESTRNARR